MSVWRAHPFPPAPVRRRRRVGRRRPAGRPSPGVRARGRGASLARATGALRAAPDASGAPPAAQRCSGCRRSPRSSLWRARWRYRSLCTSALAWQEPRTRGRALGRALGLAVAWPLGQYLGARDSRGRARAARGARRLMRVLLIVHGYPPTAPAAPRSTRTISRRRWPRSPDVRVFVLTREADPQRPDGDVRREQFGPGLRRPHQQHLRIVPIVRGHLPASRSSVRPPKPSSSEIRPDIAHVHHLTCLSTDLVAT